MNNHRIRSREVSSNRINNPNPKPSLAALMSNYSPDDDYNIKLNMNCLGPQLVETKIHHLSAKTK